MHSYTLKMLHNQIRYQSDRSLYVITSFAMLSGVKIMGKKEILGLINVPKSS